MRIFKNGAWLLVLLAQTLVAMEEKTLTSETFVKAVQTDDRKSLMDHKYNNIPATKEILWQIYTTQNRSLYELFLKQPCTLTRPALNKFVEEGSQKYGLHSEPFFSFVHRLIGITGIIPTVGGFETIEFYANPFVRWYCQELEKNGLTLKDFELFGSSIEKQRKKRKLWSPANFFNAGYIFLQALLFDDDEIHDIYFMQSGRHLTYQTFKEYHPIGYLILLACIASAMGNSELIEMILTLDIVPFDSALAFKHLGCDFVFESFMAHYSDFLYEDHNTKNLCNDVGEYWKFPQKKAVFVLNFASIAKALVSFFNPEPPVELTQLFFSGALKIACMYHQLDLAKLLINRADIHSDETFDRVKEVLGALSQFIKTSEKHKRKLYKRKLYAFIALHSQLKQFVFNERFYKKVMEKKHLMKHCTLPLLDESKNSIIVPAEIGLKILEYCPLVYTKLALKK